MRRSGRFRRLLGTAASIAVLAGSLAAFPALSTALGSFWEKPPPLLPCCSCLRAAWPICKNRFQDDLVQDEPISASQPQAEKPIQSAISAQEPSIPAQSQAESQSQSTIVIPQTPESPSIETIAPQNRGTITEKTFTADQSSLYIPLSAGYIKNSTSLSNQQVLSFYWLSPWNLRWKIPTSLRY